MYAAFTGRRYGIIEDADNVLNGVVENVLHGRPFVVPTLVALRLAKKYGMIFKNLFNWLVYYLGLYHLIVKVKIYRLFACVTLAQHELLAFP